MKEKRGFWLAGLVIPVVLLFCAGCKPPNDTGIDVLPREDSISAQYVDSFTVEMRSFRFDSIRTINSLYSLFGEYVDPEFGRISAATWTQFKTSGDNIIFGTDTAKLTLDSIVLTLNLEGYYGKYDEPMTLRIYEITEAFLSDSLSSTDSLAVAPLDIANGYTIDFSGQSNPSDELRIRLDNSLGNKILFAPSDSLVTNATFQSFFKGLHIRAKHAAFSSREPGGVFAVNLLSNRSGLTLYYKDSTVAKSYSFIIDDDTKRFHNIHRSEYETKLLAYGLADTANASPQYGFSEAGALVKLFIKFPYLRNLEYKGVNNAELEIKVDDTFLGSDERFNPPSNLLLFYADSTGQTETGIPVSNADYDAVNHAYHIPLTNNIQALINGQKSNTGFILVPSKSDVTLNRAVIGGPSHATLAPRLKVVFTNIPE